MKAILVLVSLLFLASVSFAQDNPSGTIPQEEVDGWRRIEGLGRDIFSFSLPKGQRWWAGSPYRIYVSDDRGETWETVSNPTDSPDTYGSHRFLNSQFGFTVDKGNVFRTTDGGKTWQGSQVSGNSVSKLQMFDAESGVANTGIHACLTFDSGKTWSCNSMLQVPINDVTFATPKIGFAVGTTIPWFEPYEPSAATFQRTTDGGETWKMLYTGFDEDWASVFPLSPDTLIVAAGQGKVYRSVDSGTTWKKCLIDPQDKALLDLCFVSPTVGFAAAGLGGAIMKTTDGGQSWHQIAAVGSTYWSKIKFSDTLTGFVCGPEGVWKTTNGGKAWIPLNPPTRFHAPRIYPNPATEQLTVEYSLDLTEEVTITILDGSGKVVSSPMISKVRERGAQEELIPLMHLPSGSYTCRLSAGGATLAVPFTIIR